VDQWVAEVREKAPALTVAKYHGALRRKLLPPLALAVQDVVVTTYMALVMDWREQALLRQRHADGPRPRGPEPSAGVFAVPWHRRAPRAARASRCTRCPPCWLLWRAACCQAPLCQLQWPRLCSRARRGPRRRAPGTAWAPACCKSTTPPACILRAPAPGLRCGCLFVLLRSARGELCLPSALRQRYVCRSGRRAGADAQP